VKGVLKRLKPAGNVGRTRYTIGLVLFFGPVLFAWIASYVPSWMRNRFVVAMTVVGGLITFNAAAEEDATMAAARQAVRAFTEAVASADVDAVEAILAPEFQIMRAQTVSATTARAISRASCPRSTSRSNGGSRTRSRPRRATSWSSVTGS
jgi:hypothetical protein